MFDIRGYDPDATYSLGKPKNIVGHGFDYAADYAAWAAARELLREAREEFERIGNEPIPSGDRTLGQRHTIEFELSKHRVLMLRGIFAQCEEACASYPAEVKTYAEDRGWCPIPEDLVK